MKKISFKYLGIAILSICIYLCGCSETKYQLTNGCYYAEESEYAIIAPAISFSCDSNTFQFTFDPASSYLTHGTYEIIDQKVIATTYDSENSYVFVIIDSKTLKFVENESSKIIVTGGGVPVTDGMIFKYK